MQEQEEQQGCSIGGIMSKAVKLITPSLPYNPSSSWRSTLFASGGLGIAAQAAKDITNNNEITAAITTFPQIMLSLFVLCRYDTCMVDKFMALLLTLFSLGVFITASMRFFDEENCEDSSALLCLLFLYCKILYNSVLAAFMAITETSKALNPTAPALPDAKQGNIQEADAGNEEPDEESLLEEQATM